MRPRHVLRPNHRNTYPYNCVWLDGEAHRHGVGTPEETHTLAFGWALHRERKREDEWTEGRWLRFTRPGPVWKWVTDRCRNRRTMYVWAHNMGYDGTLARAWTTLPRLGWTLQSAIIDSPPFIVRLRKGTATLILVDTINLWTTSLERIGEIVDLPKLDMPPGPPEGDAWDMYCRRDVEIIDAMCRRWWRWLRSEDMGQARMTMAGQAMSAFRHQHMKHSVLVHSNPEALDLARNAYHGGRCEAWTVGDLPGPTQLWDVTSLYPYCMREWLYPVKLIGTYMAPTLTELRSALTKWCLIADVDLDTPEPIYPYGGARRLTFPTGRFRTHLCTPELRWALERNHVASCSHVAVYRPAFLFRSYIDHLWALRSVAKERGDHFYDQATKLLMNSLYGKFGQTGHDDQVIATGVEIDPAVWTEIDADTGDLYRMRRFMGALTSSRREGESFDSVPEIAAHVTAYGRIVLWATIREVGADHVHYMDTDSLLIDTHATRPLGWLPDNDALGKWSLRGTYDSGRLYGPKDYCLGGENKTKGVRANATWLDPARVAQEQWVGLRSLIEIGDVDHPRIRRIEKHLRRTYTKGVVLPSGRVRPWSLPDERDRLLDAR